jgi:hypothetical protein
MQSIVRITLVSLCLLFMNTLSLKAQWQEISNIYGGNPLKLIEETPTKLVGIAETRVYIANKSDYFWQEVPEFAQTQIFGMTTSDDTIFVLHRGADPDQRVYLKMSLDEGNTWQTSQLIANSGYSFMSLAYIDQQLILSGYIDGEDKLMKSTDLGATWVSEVLPINISEIVSILDKNETHILFKVWSSVANGSNTFSYSIANGTWHAMPNLTNSAYASEAFIYGDRIYSAIEEIFDITVYSYALDGSDFQTLYTTSDFWFFRGFIELNGVFALEIAPDASSTTYELYTSNDNGQTFTLQGTLNNTPVLFGDIPLSNGECLISNNSNLYLMSSDFQNYETITNGLILTQIGYIASFNDALWTSKVNVSFQRSTDNGSTFNPFPSSHGTPYGGIAHSGDTLFYNSMNEAGDLIGFRSFDNGLTVETLPTSDFYLNINSNTQKSVFYHNKLYSYYSSFATNSNLATSTDVGETWFEIPNPDIGMETGNFLVANDNLYLYGEDLYRFDESNTNWIALNSPVIVLGGALYGKLKALGNNLWLSNDVGEQIVLLADQTTWVDPGVYLRDVALVGDIAYGLGSQYLYTSADYGQSWQSTGITVPPAGCDNLVSHGGFLFVSGGYNSSIWKLALPQIVSGVVYYDANSNSIKDQNEFGIPQILIHSQNNETFAMSGPTGAFTFYYNGNSDQLTVEVNNTQYTAVPQNFTVNGTEQVNIGIQIEGSISDLMTDAIVYSPFRPGFSTSATLHLANLGNVVQGGELVVGLPENVSFTSASVEPVSQTGNTLTFSIADLQAFESRQIQLNMLTAVTATLGDTAILTATLTTETTDINTNNNQAIDSSIVVGSYDPNDKTCSRGVLVTPMQLSSNNEFEYLIRFQNTGTFYAENVVIQDTISTYFDLTSLRIIATSDSMNITFGENNLVNFNFPLIFLPDSTTNEPGSHGFVKYAIRTKPDLQLGTYLRNTAYIYFDFNAPIITNTAETLYDLTIGYEIVDDQSILVYPNPTTSTVTLMEYANQTVSVSMTDISGKAVAKQMCVNGELDLSKLNPGIYLGVIQASQGQSAKRFKVVKM